MDKKWFQIVVRDDTLLREFEIHKESGSVLCTKMYFGKKLFDCLSMDLSDPQRVLCQLNWTEEFVLVDILNYKMGIYRSDISKRFIRVEETPTWNNVHDVQFCHYKPRYWDIIVSPEYFELINEMIKLKICGVKTTVAIWNSVVFRYFEIQIDGEDHVVGEIHLKSCREANKVLTTVVFHHEKVSEAKERQSRQSSELRYGQTQRYPTWHASQGKCHLSSITAKLRDRVRETEKHPCSGVAASYVKDDDDSQQSDDVESANNISIDDKGEFVLDTDVDSKPSEESLNVNNLRDLANTFLRNVNVARKKNVKKMQYDRKQLFHVMLTSQDEMRI